MKNRWLGLLGVLPLLLLLVFVNYYYDPANVLHDFAEEAAEAIMNGDAIAVTSGNLDLREIKRQIIVNMPDEVGCVAVGPSLAMGIGRENVGTESFYNLGVQLADFYDVMAQFGLMEIHGKTADKVIICVDSHFFDRAIFSRLTNHEGLQPYAEYMMDVLEGVDTDASEVSANIKATEKIEQLFSISYFQASVDYIRGNGLIKEERWMVVDASYDRDFQLYLPDASLVYSKDYQEHTEEYVRNDALAYDIGSIITANASPDAACKEVFEDLIVHLQSKGTEVVLYLCPFAPSLWDRYDGQMYPMLPELEEFANEMAVKYGLKITGSYNPYNMNMSDADFYDARHIRNEKLKEYFEFQ